VESAVSPSECGHVPHDRIPGIQDANGLHDVFPDSTAFAFLDACASADAGDVLSLQCQDRGAALVAVPDTVVGWLVPVLSPRDLSGNRSLAAEVGDQPVVG
jgi:hypothetical protein